MKNIVLCLTALMVVASSINASRRPPPRPTTSSSQAAALGTSTPGAVVPPPRPITAPPAAVVPPRPKAPPPAAVAPAMTPEIRIRQLEAELAQAENDALRAKRMVIELSNQLGAGQAGGVAIPAGASVEKLNAAATEAARQVVRKAGEAGYEQIARQWNEALP